MSNEQSLKEKVASSEVKQPLKDLLAGLVDEVESLSPLLQASQKRRVSNMTERLVNEVLDPGLEAYIWEVALDFITKAARSQEERGKQVSELVAKLTPELRAYFGPPGEVSLQEITEKTVHGVILLSETLTEPKINFVAPNAVSLAQALFSKHAWYRAIYAGKSLVGF